ncbi:MAG: COX15/CtaA family protein [Alphaproteobacteria bacterium]
MTTTAAPSAPAAPETSADDRAIAIWLLVCCAMIFAMAVIGAITRLTESGLSIMEWAPVTGALPPLSTAEWERVFAIYRQIPEYTELNRDMTLAEFKTIFWWEYVHRLWGRAIGVVFLAPFLWFLLRGRIRRALAPHLVVMFLLGGLQGALGWYMVASGFAGRTDVSQYRLVAHLGAAVAIYLYLLWVALGLLFPAPETSADPRAGSLRRWLILLLALAGVTLASGGFVAGINAGLVYNTFPLMDGEWVPSGYGLMAPWVLNLFENEIAVQFNHRLLAVATAGLAGLLWFWSRRLDLSARARLACELVLAMAVLQFGLGVATLLLVVPVRLAALHQAGALGLVTLAIWAVFVLRPISRARP